MVSKKPTTKIQHTVTKLSAVALAVRTTIIGIGLVQGAVQAATIQVNSNLDDDGLNCTLREAVVSINSATLESGCSIQSGVLGSDDTITFSNSLAGDTITLSGSEISIAASMAIDASTINGITVSGDNASKVISIIDVPAVTLKSMNILNASTEDLFGGGVDVVGSYVGVHNSTVSGNTALAGGGGIAIRSNSSANIANTTIANNSSGFGAGVVIVGSSVSISNSTISGNFAINGAGGGIGATGGDAVLSLSSSTISGNSSSTVGGGLNAYRATVSMHNSIVANSFGSDCNLFYATVNSDSFNIIQDGSCGTNARDVDPMLGPLADNGGANFTHALLESSPAINTGNSSACDASDQRGVERIGTCDVGAFESSVPEPILETDFIVISLPDGRLVVVPN